MTKLDPKALDAAAARMTLAASAMHPLDLKLLARTTITAYRDERRKQGWEEYQAEDIVRKIDRAILRYTAAEREACTKIADELRFLHPDPAFNRGYNDAADTIAAAIRARSNLDQGEEKG